MVHIFFCHHFRHLVLFSFSTANFKLPWSLCGYQEPLALLFHSFYVTQILFHFTPIIIHQTHYEKSDWSRAFNQFTIACELDMINAISAADIAFIMSSSTSGWLLFSSETKWLNASLLFLRMNYFEKCIIKQLLNSVFTWYHELSKPQVCVICLSLRLRQITQTSVLIIHDIMLNLIQ